MTPTWQLRGAMAIIFIGWVSGITGTPHAEHAAYALGICWSCIRWPAPK